MKHKNDINKKKLTGYEVIIDSERGIFCAELKDGTFYFLFSNGPQKTELKLSKEAMAAMSKLILWVDLDR
jgi:hypothetical protein